MTQYGFGHVFFLPTMFNILQTNGMGFILIGLAKHGIKTFEISKIFS
jgi:hypothetical protein